MLVNKYPLPRVEDHVEGYEEGPMTFFSTMDLPKGFHQILIAKEDQEKTGFVFLGGFYNWLYLPFGLQSGPSVFQALMDKIL